MPEVPTVPPPATLAASLHTSPSPHTETVPVTPGNEMNPPAAAPFLSGKVLAAEDDVTLRWLRQSMSGRSYRSATPHVDEELPFPSREFLQSGG
jgi:hypothetical protein